MIKKKIPTVQIRRTIYRGKEGFLIIECGSQPYFGAKIFTETRSSAERIRDKVKAGIQTTLEDFEP